MGEAERWVPMPVILCSQQLYLPSGDRVRCVLDATVYVRVSVGDEQSVVLTACPEHAAGLRAQYHVEPSPVAELLEAN
jgi:hypothetical protein